jgi:hypothetical protein
MQRKLLHKNMIFLEKDVNCIDRCITFGFSTSRTRFGNRACRCAGGLQELPY